MNDRSCEKILKKGRISESFKIVVGVGVNIDRYEVSENKRCGTCINIRYLNLENNSNDFIETKGELYIKYGKQV